MDLFRLVEPVSLSERKYTLVVVDDYSRYIWVIFLKKKKETLEKLPKLLKKIQNEQGQSIIKIKSDRGTEFVNGVITQFCSEIRIQHEFQLQEYHNKTELQKEGIEYLKRQ